MNVASLFAAFGFKVDEKSVSVVDTAIARVKQFVVAYAGMKTIGFLRGMIDDTVAVADKLDDMSQMTGLNTQLLQELGYAADLSASSLEGIVAGIKGLTNSAKSAKGGADEAAKGFRTVGVSAKALLDGSLPLEDALARIADKFAGMENGPKKVALATQLFGKQGQALIPFLNNGADGLAELREEFQRTGAALDGGEIAQLKEYKDGWHRLGVVWQGIKQRVVLALLPALQSALDKLGKWVAANQAIIKSALAAAITALSVAFRVAAWALDKLIKAFQWLLKNNEVLIAAAVVLGASMVSSAAAAAVAWLAAIAPILLMVIAIAGLIKLVKLVGPTLWRALTTVAERIVGAFRLMRDRVRDAIASIKQFVVSTAAGIRDAFIDAFNWIKNKARDAADWLGNLPVIKQLGDAGRAIGGALRGKSDDEAEADRLIAEGLARTRASRAAAPAGSTSTTSTTNVNAPITVNAAPGMTPEDVAAAVGDHLRTELRNAHAATGGADG